MTDPATTTSLENTLASIWADALGIVEADPDANFYDLGGSSIISMQIAARAKEAGIMLRAHQIFMHPTLRGLAAVLTEAKS